MTIENIAHREQSIEAHLEETSKLAGMYAKKIGLTSLGKLVGLLHDFGKYSSEFQNYIRSAMGILRPDDDDFIDVKMKKGKIAFTNQVPGELHYTFDMHDFQQMLLNLFINAIHAMRDGGTLEVKANEDDADLTIAVVDSGCGIEAENIGRIFDPFFTTKPTGEGTGLGLWLTYEIIRNYNGEITVDSEPGKGCSFVMKFPVVRKS